MSAHVVARSTIDTLVAAGLRLRVRWRHDGEAHELTVATTERAGAMLWAENIQSVAHRYSPSGREQAYGTPSGGQSHDLELPGSYSEESIGGVKITMPEWAAPYAFRRPKRTPAPVEVLATIDYYEYQACEHDAWPASEANAFCEALRRQTITTLPGYEQARSS